MPQASLTEIRTRVDQLLAVADDARLEDVAKLLRLARKVATDPGGPDALEVMRTFQRIRTLKYYRNRPSSL